MILSTLLSNLVGIGKPICFLYKRKDDRTIEFVPQYLFLLAYSNFAFEMFIPFCDADKFLQGNDMQLIFAPTPEDLNQYVKTEYLYLESEEKIVAYENNCKCPKSGSQLLLSFR